MSANLNQSVDDSVRRLMVADTAMWSGDISTAERVLLELVRKGFIRQKRLKPTTIIEWVQRTAEARLRQLYYRRGRDRRHKLGRNSSSSLAEERTGQSVFIDRSESLKVRCTQIDEERIVVRGYFARVDSRASALVLRNAMELSRGSEIAISREKTLDRVHFPGVVKFTWESADGRIHGKFRYATLGLFGGRISALPSVDSHQKEITNMLAEVLRALTDGLPPAAKG